LSKVSAGHEMDEDKLSKVSAGHEMAGQTQSIVISNSTVMRWFNTNTVKCVSHEGWTHCQKCRS